MVAVVGWDAQWPALAWAEVARLAEIAPAVEHVGSTAVPGLASVPILDLVVGVDTADDHSDAVVHAMERLGYEPTGAWEVADRVGTRLRRESEPPVEAWLVEMGGPEWTGAIALRDYLRTHQDEAYSYERAKRRAAEDGPPRDVYAERKRAMLETLADRARRWKAQHPLL